MFRSFLQKMKFLIVLCLIQISITSAYILNPVEGVNNHVDAVNFDLDGNIYVATANSSNRFLHKLNPSRQLLWTIDLPSYVAITNEIFVNSRKDIYLHFLGDFILALLRDNSTTFEIIDDRVDYSIFMDTDENIVYCRVPECYVLRPNSTVPIPIENIDNMHPGSPPEVAFDSEGNVYFTGNFADDLKTGVVLLTKQALQEDIPYATTFRNFSDPYPQFIRNFFVDGKKNFWAFVIDYENNQGTIKKLENNNTKTIFVDNTRPDIKGLLAKNRIYVAVYQYYSENVPTIFYITPENEIVDIPQLKNLTRQKYFSIRLLADEDGYAYFQTNSELTPELGTMIVIKPNETEPIPIGFNGANVTVDRMFLDYNDDVWIFAVSGDMHFLKKGEVVVEQIPNFRETCTFIHSNLVTKEVFFSCFSGLYVALAED